MTTNCHAHSCIAQRGAIFEPRTRGLPLTPERVRHLTLGEITREKRELRRIGCHVQGRGQMPTSGTSQIPDLEHTGRFAGGYRGLEAVDGGSPSELNAERSDF